MAVPEHSDDTLQVTGRCLKERRKEDISPPAEDGECLAVWMRLTVRLGAASDRATGDRVSRPLPVACKMRCSWEHAQKPLVVGSAVRRSPILLLACHDDGSPGPVWRGHPHLLRRANLLFVRPAMKRDPKRSGGGCVVVAAVVAAVAIHRPAAVAARPKANTSSVTFLSCTWLFDGNPPRVLGVFNRPRGTFACHGCPSLAGSVLRTCATNFWGDPSLQA